MAIEVYVCGSCKAPYHARERLERQEKLLLEKSREIASLREMVEWMLDHLPKSWAEVSMAPPESGILKTSRVFRFEIRVEEDLLSVCKRDELRFLDYITQYLYRQVDEVLLGKVFSQVRGALNGDEYLPNYVRREAERLLGNEDNGKENRL